MTIQRKVMALQAALSALHDGFNHADGANPFDQRRDGIR
jgi:hypothetical protein